MSLRQEADVPKQRHNDPPRRDFDPVPLKRLSRPVRQAVMRTRQWLLGQQHANGHWCAELEGDTTLQSETILLLAYLGREDSDLAIRAADTLVEKQLPDGGWAMYPGGSVEISGSVKAYFALKLTGHDPSGEYMQRARRAILAGGGADAASSFTRFYLALLGQISYDECPAVPPEMVQLPGRFPIDLARVRAWTRAMIVPLSVVSANRPVREIPGELGIRELFLKAPNNWPPRRAPDMDRSTGLGASYRSILWSILALKSLGYDDDSEELTECYDQLEALVIDREDELLRIQPCKSPVGDTAITFRSLAASGMQTDSPAMVRAAGWLLDNDFSPNVGDRAMVLMALQNQFESQDRASGETEEEPAEEAFTALPPELRLRFDAAAEDAVDENLEQTPAAIERGLQWLLTMQNKDGGWGAFDRDNEFLCHVPFADHNAMIDPSTADITARVLECLATLGRRVGDPAVDRAVAFLRNAQEADGSWFGRWGVNYIYGTWKVLTGLTAVGVSADDPMIDAGANWLVNHQQPCGGWGESPDSYDDPALRGDGEPTASQTAWAVLGLLAAGRCDHTAVTRGVQYLTETQRRDGTWHEDAFTGTGFPRVFYLRYHYYPICFPLLALSEWARKVDPLLAIEEKPQLRLVCR